MPDTDFSDALARLLTDGLLRDRFAADPDTTISSLCEDALIRAQLLTLKIDELEVQAEILLRKRFEVIRHMLPALIHRLEAKAWPLFRQYGRACWRPAPQDALGFAEYAQAGKREINRLRFTLQKNARVKLHLITEKKTLPALQILVRAEKSRWREVVLSLGF